jgi:transglycosylase-like protein with SLT domain
MAPKLATTMMMLACSLAFQQDVLAQDMVMRYRCELPDGSTVALTRPPSADFQMGMGQCIEEPAPAVPEVRMSDPVELPLIARRDPSAITVDVQTIYAARELATWLERACVRHGVHRALAAAVMYTESRFRPQARSPKGALGLMQLMPATASRYGVRSARDLLDPRINIDVGVRHLRDLLNQFPGRLDLAVAAYNAGAGAVVQHGYRVPPYTETQRYVEQVLRLAHGLPAL